MSTWKIGKIGEQLIEDYLTQSNWLTYPAPDERHPIDWILATKDKKTIALADAKTKPRRISYFDTGINLTHYEEYEYLRHKYNTDVLLIFVDSMIRKIYGNYLSNLTSLIKVNGQQYPLMQPTKQGIPIFYFPISSMKQIDVISEEHAKELNQLSKRTYEYNASLDTSFILQPALFNSPYKPKLKKVNNHDDPTFLKRLLLVKTCQCGQNRLNPNLHEDYCEYKLLLKGQE